jgi:hypothetical protein
LSSNDTGINLDTFFEAIASKNAITAFDKVLKTDIQRLLIGKLNYKSKIISLFLKYPIRISDEIKDLIVKKTKKLYRILYTKIQYLNINMTVKNLQSRINEKPTIRINEKIHNFGNL